MTRILFFLITTLAIASCSSTRKAGGVPVVIDTIQSPVSDNPHDSVKYIGQVYDNIVKRKITFNNFSARVNVDYKDDKGQQQNVSVYLRMKQDSVIWFSVNAIFGIEVMRALITPGSVKLLDKTNKIYIERPITYLYEMTGLPLNFYALQDLLIGNVVFLEPPITAYHKVANDISLLSAGNIFRNLSVFEEINYTVQRSRLDDLVDSTRFALLGYSDYVFMDRVLFSKERHITVNDGKRMDLVLTFQQVDFKEQLTFPFSIPKNYTAN